MASSWNPDFIDLITCLNTERVEYVVVGAFALAAHGLPRATGDIDLLVRPSSENARRLFSALKAFGAPVAAAAVTEADFAKPGIVYQMGLPPRRIDVLTEISGVSFDEARAAPVSAIIDGQPVSFIGLDALIANKRAAARPRDLADVSALERLHKPPRK